MNTEYFNKTTVAYKFKWEVLKQWEGPELTLKQKETLWKAYLVILKMDSLISPHQADTWKYPVKLIKNA